jgi:C-methyltransferase
VTRPTTQLLTGQLHDWAAGRDRLDILDLACGHGLYGYSLAQQHPHARVCSVDGPKVLEIAQKHAARLGVADRVQTLPGDMFALPLGGPYDLVLVTNVLHHYAEDQAVELLRRAAAVTVPGGRIALVGITLEEGPVRANAEAHLFSLLMLVWTTQGEAHSSAAYERMLTAAGYTGMRLHRQSTLPMRLIIADRS